MGRLIQFSVMIRFEKLSWATDCFCPLQWHFFWVEPVNRFARDQEVKDSSRTTKGSHEEFGIYWHWEYHYGLD